MINGPERFAQAIVQSSRKLKCAGCKRRKSLRQAIKSGTSVSRS
jgi:hypothetical protein